MWGRGWALAGVLALGGCSSVQIAQRDGCWVKHTKSFPSNEKEEIGVCAREAPQWSNDRVTRLVQECMVEADYRWKNLALNAWNRGEALPPEKPEHEVMQQCMNDAATSLIRENETLGKRIAELQQQRDGLLAQTREDHQDLRENQARMTEALGEAAKRPAPSAYALATSSGTANTKSDEKPAQQQVVLPQTVFPMQTLPGPGVEHPRAPASATNPLPGAQGTLTRAEATQGTNGVGGAGSAGSEHAVPASRKKASKRAAPSHEAGQPGKAPAACEVPPVPVKASAVLPSAGLPSATSPAPKTADPLKGTTAQRAVAPKPSTTPAAERATPAAPAVETPAR